MLVSVSFVVGLAGFCYYRVLTISSEQEQERVTPNGEADTL